MSTNQRIVQVTGIVIALLAVVVLLIAIAIYATDVFFLTLLGILWAIFLAGLAQIGGRWTGLSHGWSLGIVVTLILLLASGTAVFLGARVRQQVARTSRQLDRGLSELEQSLEQYPGIRRALAELPYADQLLSDPSGESRGTEAGAAEGGSAEGTSDRPASSESDQDRSAAQDRSSDTAPDEPQQGTSRDDDSAGQPDRQATSQAGSEQRSSPMDSALELASGQVFGTLQQVFSGAFGFVVNVVFIFFVGLYLAANPSPYLHGTVRLFPPRLRSRAAEVLQRIGETLWRWLLGRIATMTITGAGTGIGLALLGLPLAFTLGVLTGLLTFIPNIGTIIALAMAMLVALPQGFTMVLGVVGVFVGFQMIESYIITPAIQQRQVQVPPALLITFQLLMAVLTGFLGVIVATPLLAIGLVLVNAVYIRDILGDSEGEQFPRSSHDTRQHPGDGSALDRTEQKDEQGTVREADQRTQTNHVHHR